MSLATRLKRLEAEALHNAVDAVASSAGVSKRKAKDVIEASNLDDLPEADENAGANFSYGYLFGVRDALRLLREHNGAP